MVLSIFVLVQLLLIVIYQYSLLMLKFESQQYIHLMGGRITRSNKPVWVVGSRTSTPSIHQRRGCLMGRSRPVGNVLSDWMHSCERTKELGIKDGKSYVKECWKHLSSSVFYSSWLIRPAESHCSPRWFLNINSHFKNVYDTHAANILIIHNEI